MPLSITPPAGTATAIVRRDGQPDVVTPLIQRPMQPLVLPPGVEPWMLTPVVVPLVLKMGQTGTFGSLEIGVHVTELVVAGDWDGRTAAYANALEWGVRAMNMQAGIINRLRQSIGMSTGWRVPDTAQPAFSPNAPPPNLGTPGKPWP